MRKVLIACLFIVSLAGVALFTSGANAPEESRPPGVDVSTWMPISDSAGIQVVRSAGHGKLAGRLYMRKGQRWTEVIIESSPVFMPVDR